MTPSSSHADDASCDPGAPEYGPAGYLPPKAAQRARKIVLREQMGLHWPIAAALAGVAILAVMLPWLLGGSGAPGDPFVDAGPLAQVDPRGDARLDVGGTEVLVVRGGGVLVAFADPPPGASFCPRSRRIESAAHQAVWSLQGTPLGGAAEPLTVIEARAVDDRLYLDLDHVRPASPGRSDAVTPQCG